MFLTFISHCIKKIVNFFLSSKFNQEIFIYLLFISTHFLFSRLLFHGVIVVAYIIALYAINKNLTKSLWIVLLSTVLFNLGRYFPHKYSTPFSGDLVESYKVFGVSFTDIILLILLYWIKRSHETIRASFSRIDILVFIIFFFSILSTTLSPHQNIAWFNLWQLIKLIIFFYLSRILFWKPGYKKITTILPLIYLSLNSILMIMQKLKGGLIGLLVENYLSKYGNYAQDAPALFRPGGMSWDANYSASFLSLGVIFLVHLVISKSKMFNKRMMLIMISLFSVAIIISASRGSWLVTVFSIGIIILNALVQKKFFLKQYLKLKIIVPIILITLIPSSFIIERLQQFSSKMGQSTINTRLVHLKLGYTLARNYQFGVGPDVFRYQIMSNFQPEEYLFDSTPSHMMIGELLGDFGILGTLSFILLFYCILREQLTDSVNKQGKSGENQLLSIGLFYLAITYILLAQIYPLFFSFQISVIFWIALGALSYDQKSKNFS